MHSAHHHEHDAHVDHDADDQCDQNGSRDGLARRNDFFGGHCDQIEAYVGDVYQRHTAGEATEPKRRKRLQVGCFDLEAADDRYADQHSQLDQVHDRDDHQRLGHAPQIDRSKDSRGHQCD